MDQEPEGFFYGVNATVNGEGIVHPRQGDVNK